MKLHSLIFLGFMLLFSISACGEIEDDTSPSVIMPGNVIDSSYHPQSDSSIICTYEKYMDLEPDGNRSAQATACYGDYLVQGYNYNGYITVYDLKEKKKLSKIIIPVPTPSSRTHVNTMNFGNQRFHEGDYFPLLYISSGYPTDGLFFIYVYRLERDTAGDKETFRITLVQTITLDGFENWTEGVIDNDNNRLFVIHYPYGYYCYATFNLPLLEEGDVTLFKQNCINDVWIKKIPENSRNQGQLYKDRKIIYVTGVPSTNEEIAFISIDTEKGEREYIIDLAEVGLVNPNNPKDNTFEPEGVIIYNGQLMICYRTAIYSFTIDKKRKDDYMGIGDNNVNSNDAQDKEKYDLLGKPKSDAKGISIVHSRNAYRKVIKP